MSIEQISSHVMGEILSHTGPCALGSTSKEMHAIHDSLIGLKGVELSRNIRRELWDANIFQRDENGVGFHHVVYQLPAASEPITEEQGLQILKVALDTAQCAWKQLSESDRKKLEGHTPQECCVNPRDMNEILRILDEICLLEFARRGATLFHLEEFFSPNVPREEQLQQLKTKTDVTLGNPERIPEAIGELTSVEALVFEGASLPSLPESLLKLEKLEFLDLVTADLDGTLAKDKNSLKILIELENRDCGVFCSEELREAITALSFAKEEYRLEPLQGSY